MIKEGEFKAPWIPPVITHMDMKDDSVDRDLNPAFSCLVHNVSHWNVLLAFKGNQDKPIIARIKFHNVARVCQRLAGHLRGFLQDANLSDTQSKMRGQDVPFGIDLSVMGCEVELEEAWDAFHVKNSELEHRPLDKKPMLVGIYFPIAGIIVPRWLQLSDGKLATSEKHLYLVCGSGTPWDEKDASGNDTKWLGTLIEQYLQIKAPVVQCHIIHADLSIFHYDANVRFMNTQLIPRIEKHRRDVSIAHGENWYQRLSVTFSLTDGASARVSALTAALRIFTPDCLHMWSLKRFWREFPKVDETRCQADVEYHKFDTMEVNPPKRIGKLAQPLQALVAAMVAHKENFRAVRQGDNEHELLSFWHRKSKQAVLCVLAMEVNGVTTYYRGVNMEVSLPTGSLCSERSAIGSALSDHPGLKRNQLKAIAVMTLPVRKPNEKPILTHADSNESDSTLSRADSSNSGIAAKRFPQFPRPNFTMGSPSTMKRFDSNQSIDSETSDMEGHEPSPRPRLTRGLSMATMQVRQKFPPQKTDKNPIKPCGSCTEWLKKIAEVNPDFKVVTFTTEDCVEAYVESIMQI